MDNNSPAGQTAPLYRPSGLIDPSQLNAELSTTQAALIYQPLNQARQEVRILRLRPSLSDEEPPRCQLETVSIKSEPPPKYEAISYVWSEVSGSAPIWLNGVLHDAPASSAKVLRRFRDHLQERIVWIDALCINQLDTLEKQYQISIMGDIYSGSCHTLVWLGDGEGTTAQAAKTIARLAEEDHRFHDAQKAEKDASRMHGVPDQTAKKSSQPQLQLANYEEKAFRDLLLRPWFRRIWVIQELILSPRATFYCGSHCFRCSDIVAAVRHFGVASIRTMVEDGFIEIGPDGEDESCALRLLTVVHMVEQQCLDRRKRSRAFRGLLAMGRGALSTEPRDKVFALLGLTQLPQDKPLIHDLLAVDYSKPLLDVFRDATRAAVLLGDLTPLEDCLLEREYFECMGQMKPLLRQIQDKDLPSWVLRWDIPEKPVSPWGKPRFPILNRKDGLGTNVIVMPSDPHCLKLAGYPLDNVLTIFSALPRSSCERIDGFE